MATAHPDPETPRTPAHHGDPTGLADLTAELLRLAPALDPVRAAALLRRAYRAGLADGRRETVESREHGGW
ncbi:hypothetical protein GCM10009759_23140 [Kitasatospora saccharophila]|uniref:Uncharacterized protein n=1 Tax=Kitasatospora saccharophila TaxID=407973 RepID=A0ABN2WN24_9ACTN